jgi:hypothetical protein
MSKWSKFKNTPLLFFKDMIRKRLPFIFRTASLPKNRVKIPIKANYQFNPFFEYKCILHTGENVTGMSHLDLWIPQFLKSDVDFVIMVRDYELFELLKNKYPQISILYAKDDKTISSFIEEMAFLKACFYPSNTGNNLHLLKFDNLKHIFIGHGDSDKTASAHKYFRVYDENWVAGQAHIDRFKNAGFDFRGLEHIKVGRPNLKEILELSNINWRDRFNGKLNLLYLSTWEGFVEEQNYTSVYIIKDFFKNYIQNIEFNKIGVKLHPKTGARDNNLEDFSKELSRIFEETSLNGTIFDKNIPVEQIIKGSNIFICDISAVVSESLSADAPIFVYIPKDKDIKLSKSKIDYTYYTYTFSDIDELLKKLDEVIIKKNDYLASRREEAMEYILGKKETLNDEFKKRLMEISCE